MRPLDAFMVDSSGFTAIYDVEGKFWFTIVPYEQGKPVIDIRTVNGVETSVAIGPEDYTLVGDYAIIKGCTTNRRAFVKTFPMSEGLAELLTEAMLFLAAQHAPIIDHKADPRDWFSAQGLDFAHTLNIRGMKIVLSHPEHVGVHVIHQVGHNRNEDPQGRNTHGFLLHGGIARIGHIPTSWDHVLADD